MIPINKLTVSINDEFECDACGKLIKILGCPSCAELKAQLDKCNKELERTGKAVVILKKRLDLTLSVEEIFDP